MKPALTLILVLIVLANLSYVSSNSSAEELNQPDCYYTLRIGTNIDYLSFVMPGHYFPIYISLDSIGGAPLRGFDLSIAYDPLLLELGSVVPAGEIHCWDNFEYEVEPLYNEAEPTGLNLINISAATTADLNTEIQADCAGETGYFETVPIRLVRLNFQIKSSEDKSIEPFLPVYFYWQNCQSNIISAGNQQTKFLCERVSSPKKFLPENNHSIFTVSNEIILDNHLLIVSDSCRDNFNSHSTAAEQAVYFINGGIFVELHACSRILHGDLDQDNYGHTLKDLLLFADYFIYGDSVFTIDREKQLEETDLNQDNIALSLADFVYLARVIKGDAVPYIKLHHLEKSANLYIQNDTLFVESNIDLGAVLFSISGNPESVTLADFISVKTDYVDGRRKFLLYSFEQDKAIPQGRVPLLWLNSGAERIDNFEAAGYYGDMVNAHIKQ